MQMVEQLCMKRGKLRAVSQWNKNYHTHASEASKIVPSVQKREKITIQVPRFPAGTNSKNQDENTCPLPTPMPTKNRRASKQK